MESIKDKISKTIISVTYLRKGYPHHTKVWELVVTKAEIWISNIVHSYSIVQELKRTAAANWIGTEIYNNEQLYLKGGVSLGAPNSGCYPSSVPKYNSSASPKNCGASSISARQWFQPGGGIAQGVITAGIQQHLGSDALVRPGEGTGEYEVRFSLF